tara:strand:- start:2410 stop:2553 length:144 start_codon:yes stop_codon:yes gene_type:complete
MEYGFLYFGFVFAIASLWLYLAVIPKPEFIDKKLIHLKDKLKQFLSS